MSRPAVGAELEQLARTITRLSILYGEQAGWQGGDFLADAGGASVIKFAETALRVAGLAERLARRALWCARQNLQAARLEEEDDLPF
jgi:hypothetical protein